MSYLYSQTNRLEEPHSYMYTPFQGEALLSSYQLSRMAIMLRHATVAHKGAEPDDMLLAYALPMLETLFYTASLGNGEKFRIFLGSGNGKIFERSKADHGSLVNLAKDIGRKMVAEQVITLDLLHALIAAQLTNTHNDNTKAWLDRLVQRFEVTKKLYENYPPGFRKGEGANTLVRLYWLFALVLCLFYVRSNEIKYLSTLLKVCDLLCSLPENALQEHIPEHGLSAVLSTEIFSVQLLAQKKGVSFAAE